MNIRFPPILMGLIASLMLVSLAKAQEPRFDQGTMRAGFGLGLRGTDEGVMFAVGGSFGVFVLRGLDVGVATQFQTGGGGPSHFLVTGEVRVIPFPSLNITPYLHGGGGRLFVLDFADAWMVSAGGGLLYLFGPSYGIDIGGGYRWFFFPDDEIFGTYYFQVGMLLWF